MKAGFASAVRRHAVAVGILFAPFFAQAQTQTSSAAVQTASVKRVEQSIGMGAASYRSSTFPEPQHLPVFITSLSTLGRGVMGRHPVYGGELHLDQEIRLGDVSRWMFIFGGSVGRVASYMGSAWLGGGNAAFKLDLDAHRDHGWEWGVSFDAEFLARTHFEYGQTPRFLGPYTAYTWKFTHLFFVAAETGLASRIDGPRQAPNVWGTLGFGADVAEFLS